MQLNLEQRSAVDTIEGPVLVVAGPGTGKTQMLSMRIARILEQTDTAASNILCLTFTDAGVQAMRQRLRRIIGTEAYYVSIHTFHSFCNEVIQVFPDKFAMFSGQPQQLTDLERIKLIREILDGLNTDHKYNLRPMGNSYQYQKDIIDAIQTLKREGVTAEEFTRVAQEEMQNIESSPELNKKTGKPTQKYRQVVKVAQRNVELAEIYTHYAAQLKHKNLYDYEDMILFVIQQLADDDELLGHYQEKFLYIHVDEYQDTNGAQNKLIKLLGSGHAENKPNIFAVGDDDQAIYRFQGANVDNLLFFEQQFDSVKTIPVTINYRSSQAILDLAMDSIKHNQNRLTNILPNLSKKLTAGLKMANVKPTIVELATGDDENQFVIDHIEQIFADGGSFKDIAILYRRHADAEDIIDALLRAGIPINLSAGGDALEEHTVQILVKLLKLLHQHPTNRDQITTEVLLQPFVQNKFNIDRLQVFKLITYVNDHNYFVKDYSKRISLLAAAGSKNILTQAGVDNPDGLIDFFHTVVGWQQSAAANPSLVDFLANVLQESGLFTHIFGGEVNIEEANAVNAFFQFVRQTQLMNRNYGIEDLMRDIELLEENNLKIAEKKTEIEQNSVNLLTAHGAKGLEFDYVFVIKVIHKNWGGRVDRKIIKLPPQLLTMVEQPQNRVEKKQLSQEDERRLFFVAITRTKKQLFILSAAQYVTNGTTKQTEPSQFVTELSSELYQEVDPVELQASEKNTKRLVQALSPRRQKDFTKEEKLFLRDILSKFKLSASALNEYLECPLKFKFNRLLRVPASPSAHIALGNATHKALEQQGRALMQGQKITLEKLLANFEFALQNELLGGEDYAVTLTEGKHILTKYFETYAGELSSPAGVEYNFGKHNVVLELPDQEPIVLSGKIDKLEWVDQSTNRVKIVDYKTSSYKTENAIRGLTKNSDKNIWRQLVFYVLMASLDDQFRSPSKMQKYIVDHVEVDFLKEHNGKLRRVPIYIMSSDVEELKWEIATVMHSIRSLEFHGSDTHPLCGECDYCQL